MKVCLGMSGGVDSAAAAIMLKNSGYDVVGVTLLMTQNDMSDDINAAKSVCNTLNIAHTTIDLRESFERNVLRIFADEYINGFTPNPCVICNREVKLRGLIDFADENGFDYAATGHYARLVRENGKVFLKKSADRKKDQTYMLCRVPSEMLSRLIFPLCDIEKSQIRLLASEYGLKSADKPDSQDVCFAPDGDYAGFIENLTGFVSHGGSFVDTAHNIIGKHSGHIHFTTGQRKGLGMGFSKRMYVLDKDTEKNEVTLGDDSELYSSGLLADCVNIICDRDFSSPMRLAVKTRYSQAETPCTVYINNGCLTAKFDSPVRAVTKGQTAAFYDGDCVVCGARITEELK